MFFKRDKQNLGKYGEKIAGKFLKNLGYKIVDKNYRTRAGEIDIIARDHESLVFVEVKTRSRVDFAYPEAGVHFKKMKNFQASVKLYLLINDISSPFRLDVLSVDLSKNPLQIKHFQNITM